MRRWQLVVLVFFIIALISSFSRQVEAKDEAVASGWKLVFTDDFNREELGDNWKLITTGPAKWEIRNGSLFGEGPYPYNEATLVLMKKFPGSQRLEYDAFAPKYTDDALVKITEAEGTLVNDNFLFRPGDLSAILCGDEKGYVNGYFFGFGARYNNYSKISFRGWEAKRSDDNFKARVIPGKVYHIVCQREGKKLTLTVDGKVLMEFSDKNPLTGPKHQMVGLYTCTEAYFDNVKVYTKEDRVEEKKPVTRRFREKYGELTGKPKPNPVYHVQHLKKEPIIDGKIENDAAWQDIPVATGFCVEDGGYSKEKQTFIRLADTRDSLYFAVICEELHPERLGGNRRYLGLFAEDGASGMWDENSLTFYFQPLGKKDLYQFIFSTIGKRWGRNLTTRASLLYDLCEVAAHKGKDYYSVEGRIPFAVLGIFEGAQEKTWSANFGRHDLTETGDWYSSWPSVEAKFSKPDKFGTLTFSTEGALLGKPNEFVKEYIERTAGEWPKYKECLHPPKDSPNYSTAASLLRKWQKLQERAEKLETLSTDELLDTLRLSHLLCQKTEELKKPGREIPRLPASAGIQPETTAVQRKAAPEKMTYIDLIKRLTGLEGLAVLPMPGEKCAQWSSYNRRSRYDEASGKYIDWHVAGNERGIIRREDGRSVLAEMEGPGCIWRIFSPGPGKGHVKIYLDGSTEPAVDLPFRSYFNRNNFPFIYSSLVYTVRGFNSYIPIPYQKSCKIVAEQGWGKYYHFTYTTYPKGTILPTFKRNLSPAQKAALETADKFLSNHLGTDPAGERTGEVTETKEIAIRGGKRATVLKLRGERAITALRVKINLPSRLEESTALRELVLRISWDGEKKPSVWVPLGDFFGTALAVNRYKSLTMGMTDDGFYSYWYMPFAKSAVIELANDGDKKRTAAFTVTHAPLSQPIEELGRFHAKWHRDAFLPEAPGREKDWPMLVTHGQGRFVGVMLHVWGGRRWKKGDERFFIDGEKFPSTFGTGAGDYFGHAWGCPCLFMRAFHNQTFMGWGHASLNRWHITDNVPFQRSFEGVLGTLSSNKRTIYACTAYWYLAPEGRDYYEAVPVGERTGYWTMFR